MRIKYKFSKEEVYFFTTIIIGVIIMGILNIFIPIVDYREFIVWFICGFGVLLLFIVLCLYSKYAWNRGD